MNKNLRPQTLSHRNYKTIRAVSLAQRLQPSTDALPPSFLLDPHIHIGNYTVNRSDLLGKGFCSKVYKAIHK